MKKPVEKDVKAAKSKKGSKKPVESVKKEQKQPKQSDGPKKANNKVKAVKRSPRKVGRPSRYNKALTLRVLAQLADGRSIRFIAKLPGMPAVSTIFKWLAEYEEFSKQYTRAREVGAEAIADEIFEIADNATNDYMEKFDKNGESIGWMLNGDAVQRSRLRIDARKWYLSKIMPKKYGDKVMLGSDDNNPVQVKFNQMSDEELERAIKEKLSNRED